MKGYKLNLKDYKVKQMERQEDVCAKCQEKYFKFEEKEKDYEIKKIIANVMCHPSLEHKGYRFFTVSKVADKIATAKGDSITLDKTDYDAVRESFDAFKGFTRNDSEMVQRIYGPEEVELQEKTSEKKKGRP